MKRILQTLMGVCQATVLVAALGFGVAANASEGGFPLDLSNSSQKSLRRFVMRHCYLRDQGLCLKENLLHLHWQ